MGLFGSSPNELTLELNRLRKENENLKKTNSTLNQEKNKVEQSFQQLNKIIVNLNNFSLDLAYLPYQEIFPYIVDNVRNLFEVKDAFITSYNESSSELVLEYSSLSNEESSTVSKLLGKSFSKYRNRLSTEHYNRILNEKIGRTTSLYELTFGEIPQAICKTIEMIFQIDWFLGIILIYQNKLVGTLILTGGKFQTPPNDDEVKAFTGIAANALGRKKAEEMLNISQSALKNSESQYRNLFESVPVGLTKTTVDGTLLDFNITALKLLGYNHRDEIVGKNADDFWAFREQRKLLIPKKLEDGTFEFDFQLRRKDNSLIWVRCKSKAVLDSNNITIHLENSMEDITERKKAEELLVKNEALLKKAQEISHFGHFRYTQTEGISDQSNEFLNILESNKNINNFEEYFSFCHPDDRKINFEIVNQAIDQQTNFEIEHRLLLKFSKIKWVKVKGDFVYEDNQHHAILICTVNDFTDLKNSQLLLIEQKQELETQYEEYMQLHDQLIQTNMSLEISKQKAEESDKLKTAFLHNMSHEIRTPLNGILGFSKLLQDPSNSTEEINEYIGIINNSGKRLLEIVNNVLDISKIETGQVNVTMKTFSIKNLLEQLYKFFLPSANNKSINFSCFCELDENQSYIYSDESKINQILTNLINNAIKFTHSGFVELSTKIENNIIIFIVKDSGIGISEEYLNRIFERFAQVDSSVSRRFEGAGLGLAISKGLVEILGGTINVESKLNQGTTFTLSIPFGEDNSDLSSIKENNSEIKFSKNINILIAEDDPISYLLLKNMLNNLFVEVNLLWAENGEQAIEIVKRNPDLSLIFMDINMPKMDGIIATESIRKIRSDIPIIAQTSYSFKEDLEKLHRIGCDDILTKPIENNNLKIMMEKYLN